jgi:transposase
MQIRSVGIDLGKTTFHVVALSAAGKVLLRKKFTQKQLITFTANIQMSLIGMEACSGAHFLGRALREQGHDVKLIPAQFVKPFVKSNKNDFLDAEAIAEAVDRQNMRFVPIKTDDQLDLQALHRVRDRLIARRTSVINQLRSFLLARARHDIREDASQAEAGDARDLRERRREPHTTHAQPCQPTLERVEGSRAADHCHERRG